MGGTIEGGKAAAATNKKTYGEDFYVRIGAVGGKNGHTGGFYNKELAKKAGALGGLKSKRGPWTEQDRLNYERKRKELA